MDYKIEHVSWNISTKINSLAKNQRLPKVRTNLLDAKVIIPKHPSRSNNPLSDYKKNKQLSQKYKSPKKSLIRSRITIGDIGKKHAYSSLSYLLPHEDNEVLAPLRRKPHRPTDNEVPVSEIRNKLPELNSRHFNINQAKDLFIKKANTPSPNKKKVKPLEKMDTQRVIRFVDGNDKIDPNSNKLHNKVDLLSSFLTKESNNHIKALLVARAQYLNQEKEFKVKEFLELLFFGSKNEDDLNKKEKFNLSPTKNKAVEIGELGQLIFCDGKYRLKPLVFPESINGQDFIEKIHKHFKQKINSHDFFNNLKSKQLLHETFKELSMKGKAKDII